MNRIYGIFDRTGRSISSKEIEQFSKHIGQSLFDSEYIRIEGTVALGSKCLTTTPEEKFEQHMIETVGSILLIAADIRIDNRTELSDKLNISKEELFTTSDNGLILLAYQKWRKRCFEHVLGDFAIALWDGESKELVCARDIVGVKPFYYNLSSGQFVFSSEIKPFIVSGKVVPEPNERHIAEHLTGMFISQKDTIYKNIEKLPPAHYLIVGEQHFSIHNYWKPEVKTYRRYKSDIDYLEEFSEILEKSVLSRLHSTDKVAAELSGGMDSATIVGEITRLSKERYHEPVHIASCTYPGMKCDEKSYVENIANHLAIEVNYYNCTGTIVPSLVEQTRGTLELPDPPNLTSMLPMLKGIRDSGCRVVLNGIGGDEWFTGASHCYLDMILQGKYSVFYNLLKNEYQSRGIKAFNGVAHEVVRLILPATAKRLLKRSRSSSFHFPPWLDERFIVKSGIVSLRKNFDLSYVKRTSLLPLINILRSGSLSRVLELNDRLRSSLRVEPRYPFLDKRMIEFGLSLPDSLRKKDGVTKALLRIHNRDVLPISVLNRSDKTEFSRLFYQPFQDNKKESVVIETLKANGWITKRQWYGEMGRLSDKIKNNPDGPFDYIWPIWFAIALSVWYSVNFERQCKS